MEEPVYSILIDIAVDDLPMQGARALEVVILIDIFGKYFDNPFIGQW